MDLNEKFLNEYKSLEETCRNINIDIKTLPEMKDLIDDDGENKLNICRQMRNYLCHNSNKNFVVATSSQINFITNLNIKLKEKDDICSKHLRRKLTLFGCFLSEKCSEVISRMSSTKQEYFVVFNNETDKEILGLVSIYNVAEGLNRSKTTRIKDVPLTGKDASIGYVSKLTKYHNKPNDFTLIICTDNGEKSGKILGLVI